MGKDKVREVYRVEKTSKKGNLYQNLVIVFDNGYVLEQFLTNEQVFILGHIPMKK